MRVRRGFERSRLDDVDRSDVLLKTMKAKRDAEALEARLSGREPKATTTTASEDGVAGESKLPNEAASTDAQEAVDEDAEEEGGLFGNMLDEPSPSEEPGTSANTTIQVRPMPIPKQFAFSGNLPKPLLRTALSKSSKTAVITYARLSGGSRAARAGVEVRWTPTKRRVWRMEEVACADMTEAENYVSALALHDLAADGAIQAVNWRTMPPAYRELWEELDVARKERDDKSKREVWRGIQRLLAAKTTGGDTPVAEPVSKPVVSNLEGAPSSSRPQTPAFSERLQTDFERRRGSPAYQTMLRYRSGLPIASFREEIISTLEKSQIMVLSGETGCGKSTQLPSFILEDQLAKGRPCKIFVTEPRRISAISLAQRVSQELGDAPGAMGTNSSLVGYSIRLEAKVSAATRLAFVTNGIALRMLESGSSGSGSRGTAFDEVTHIIIDEVHERSIESDFLLIVLKSLIQQRPDLKVVLMSATLDAEKISAFFGGCPFLSVPGRTFPVQVNYLEDAVQIAEWHIDETSPFAIRARNARAGAKQLEWTEEGAKADDEDDDPDAPAEDDRPADPTKLTAAKYSARTVETVNLLDSRQIPYDLIVRLLERICYEDRNLVPFSAATLVFMPGLAEIRKLNDMLQGHPAFGSGDFVVYPLHSTISSEGQSAVFDIPPQSVRKIVICE
jgi:ATP-dependent RNA helicase DHX29